LTTKVSFNKYPKFGETKNICSDAIRI